MFSQNRAASSIQKENKGSYVFGCCLAVLFLAAGCSADDDDDLSAKASLAAGSWGTPGNGTIMGLTSGTMYMVIVENQLYVVKDDGTLGSANDVDDRNGTVITGLANGITYNVCKAVKAAAGGNTTLTALDCNIMVNIKGLDDGEIYTMAASAISQAQNIFVFVGQLEAATGGVIANEEPRSKLLGSSLERKFIVLARYIPRSENRFTKFSGVVNFPKQAPGYVPRLPIKN
jgi:hypothetical protein